MGGRTIYLLSALVGGAILPVQVALNTLLRRHAGEPMQVTFVSYLAGTLASLAICLFARYPFPAWTSLSQTSWWMWVGGCLGTLYVCCSNFCYAANWSSTYTWTYNCWTNDSSTFARQLRRHWSYQISCQPREDSRSSNGYFRSFVSCLCKAINN